MLCESPTMLSYSPFHVHPKSGLPLTSLKGVGPKRAEAFEVKGISTIGDLLSFYPIRYQDRRRITPAAQVKDGEVVLMAGRIVRSGQRYLPGSGRKIFRAVVEDGSKRFELVWFNYRRGHLLSACARGRLISAFGKARVRQGLIQLVHPEIRAEWDSRGPAPEGIVPIYPRVEGVSQATLRGLIRQAWEMIGEDLRDPLPAHLLKRLGIPTLKDAVKEVHFPSHEVDLEKLMQFKAPCQRRISFGLILELMAWVLKKKMDKKRVRVRPLVIHPGTLKKFEQVLPFTLTQDQRRVLQKIAEDMTSSSPMNRLVQGDVGCGKTVVALGAAYMCAVNGRQAALMAPTQVLARQHYAYFSEILGHLNVNTVLITGLDPDSQKMLVEQRVLEGEARVIIGTHALIQDRIKFQDLRLVIIDEQQRFGVRQRRALEVKGNSPHVLVMTATPIPRTLALALYADMDVSVIREVPGYKREIKTLMIHERDKRIIHRMVKHTMEDGGQVMVVCPVIEDRQGLELKNVTRMYQGLIKLYSPRFRVGLVHGALPDHEKNQVMEQFRKGKLDLLVAPGACIPTSTTVVATMMVIEHPERFGLAQLHQLRGRVGRGGRQGVCVLVVGDATGKDGLRRLEDFARCHDGFQIAEQDLRLRGLGELTGLRQSGAGEIDLKILMGNMDLVAAAKEEIQGILEQDPDLSLPEHSWLKEIFQKGFRP